MTKIKLNDQTINSSDREYELDPTEEYLINLEEEMEFQMATMMSIQIMGAPPALKNYHAWLFENGFDVKVVEDCSMSHSGIEYHNSAINMLKKLIGSQNIVKMLGSANDERI